MSDARLARSAGRVFPGWRSSFGLCIGSFLNVVIHRLPRCWSASGAREMRRARAAQPRPAAAKSRPLQPGLACRARAARLRPRISALREHPGRQLAGAARQMRGVQGAHQRRAIRWSSCSPASARSIAPGASASTCQALAAAVFFWCTIALAFIDQETGSCPTTSRCRCCGSACSSTWRGRSCRCADAVIGAVAGYLSLWLVYWSSSSLTGKEGMGYGDFKLIAAVGALLGWKMLPLVILLSSFVGLRLRRAADVRRARRLGRGTSASTSGPTSPSPALVALFWGNEIAHRCRRCCGRWDELRSRPHRRHRQRQERRRRRVRAPRRHRGRHRRHRARAHRGGRRGHGRNPKSVSATTFIAATGAMDRDKMRDRVFADPAAKQALEALLHPMIREESRRRIAAARGALRGPRRAAARRVGRLPQPRRPRAGGRCSGGAAGRARTRRSGLSEARCAPSSRAQATRAAAPRRGRRRDRERGTIEALREQVARACTAKYLEYQPGSP